MKDIQTIKRSDLKIIYGQVCDKWKKEIQDLILWSDSKNINVPNSLINKAYKEADTDQKKLIIKYFEIKEDNNYLKISSLDDIYKIRGFKDKDIIPFTSPINESQKRLNNIARLEFAAEFYNGEWKVKFDGIQRNYYPWFLLLSGVWVAGDVALFGYDGSSGSLVYFESNEKAVHFGKTFLNIYKELLNLQDSK